MSYYCIECNSEKWGEEVTFDERCDDCGSNLYGEEEIQAIYNKTRKGGWQTRHDLYNMRDNLYTIKRDPFSKTAQNELWIDVLIRELAKMEKKFTN